MQLLLLVALFAAAQGFAPAAFSGARLSSRTIVMDGKTRDLRDRIKSIKNTRRITEAMRLVAAARVRRAQDAVLKTRPLIAQLQLVGPIAAIFSVILFSISTRNLSHSPPIFRFSVLPHLLSLFSSQVYKTVLEACNQEDLVLPILEVRDVKKLSLVLVTGDRGLCGGYNSQVIKQCTRRIEKLKAQGIATQLILVGRKGEQWFVRRPTPVAATFVLGNVPQPSVGSELANLLVAQFLTGEIDAAEIIYTRFNNLISSTPTIRTLLPLSITGIESEEDEIFMMTTKDGKMVMRPKGETAAPAGGVVTTPDYIFEDEPTGA